MIYGQVLIFGSSPPPLFGVGGYGFAYVCGNRATLSEPINKPLVTPPSSYFRSFTDCLFG